MTQWNSHTSDAMCANKDTSSEASSACHRRTNLRRTPTFPVNCYQLLISPVCPFLSAATCEPQRRRSVQDLPGISTEHRESNHVRKQGHFLYISHTWVCFGTQLISVKVPGSSQKRTGISCCVYKTQFTLDVDWCDCVYVLLQGSRNSSRSSSPSVRMLPLDKTGGRGHFSPDDPTGTNQS